MMWLSMLTLPSVLILSGGMAIANPLISLEDAATLAQASHSGFIIEVDLEDDEQVWDVEFADDREVEIDARTGNLSDTDRDDDQILNLPSSVISVWNAVAIARSVVPGSEPIEANLDVDDGRLAWDVDFRNDIEVEIDALSGAILAVDD